jgi:hypothetical protein
LKEKEILRGDDLLQVLQVLLLLLKARELLMLALRKPQPELGRMLRLG